jgi:hypothetical protein
VLVAPFKIYWALNSEMTGFYRRVNSSQIKSTLKMTALERVYIFFIKPLIHTKSQLLPIMLLNSLYFIIIKYKNSFQLEMSEMEEVLFFRLHRYGSIVVMLEFQKYKVSIRQVLSSKD